MAGLIILMAAVVLAGIGCIIYGCYQLWFTRMVQRKGIALRGTIVDRITRDNRGPSKISYRYEFEGKGYINDQRITIRHIDNFDRGSMVTVYCLPRNPSQARIWDTSWYTRMILMGVGLVLLILFILPIFITGVQNGRIT
jgi:hypothetical protein